MEHPVSHFAASAMQLAIAPVFLISAVSVLLTCMSHRYGRVIDRIRTLLREGDIIYGKYRSADHVRKELRALYRRARLLRWTIITSTLSIFFVIAAIFMLFLDLTFRVEIPMGPESAFLMSLVVLLISIGLFIEDFAISLHSIKHDINTRSDIVE